MRRLVQGMPVVLLIVLPYACTAAPTLPAAQPSLQVASPQPPEVPTSTVALQATSAAPTPLPPTSTATPMLDATRLAAMTLEAIRLAVTASGVPEGSTEFDAQVAQLRCALLPPPTPTPLPWRLVPQVPSLESANCLGSDLPRLADWIWQDGTWIEASGFEFADSANLEAARQAYAAYLEFIAFQDDPPTSEFRAQLVEHMNSTGILPAPESCLDGEIADAVESLWARGQYVRLTFTQPLTWGEDYHLFVTAIGAQVALPWSATAVRQELLAADTGAAIRQATATDLAGTALLGFDAGTGRWYVADDDGGYYCNVLPDFVE